MSSKFVAGVLASISGGLILGIIVVWQNSSAFTDYLILAALFYYSPAMCLLILLSRGLMHVIRASESLFACRAITVVIFALIIFLILISRVGNKIIQDYEFLMSFCISYLLAMLLYLVFKKILH